jgi:hypothetical protein
MFFQVFLLLTVLSYLKAVVTETNRTGRRRWIAVSAMLYVLSLLSKASGMTLPVVLLVLDVYPLRRLGVERANGLAQTRGVFGWKSFRSLSPPRPPEQSRLQRSKKWALSRAWKATI